MARRGYPSHGSGSTDPVLSDRLPVRGVTDETPQPAGRAGEVEVNFPLDRFKANVGDLPGGFETQGRREQQIGFHGLKPQRL